MIREASPDQLALFRVEDFQTPFGAGLDPANRWVRWAQQIPWRGLAAAYHQSLAPGGRPAKPARLVIGALIIKHRLGLSDVETIEQLRENPYLQYFCGFERFEHEPAFAPTLFVKLRERLTPERFALFEQAAIERMAVVESPADGGLPASLGDGAGEAEEASAEGDRLEAEGEAGGEADKASSTAVSVSDSKDTLIVDASVAEQQIRYPNDVGLVAEARQSGEGLIDHLWERLKVQGAASGRKPRTYRRAARRAFTGYSKQGRRSARRRRAARRVQLQYLRRDLDHIDRLLDAWEALEPAPLERPFTYRQWRRLWVIREVFRQQALMHRERSQRIADRIVSLSQPQVRPIVRGRLGHPVEFGPKFSVSLAGGLACVDALRWEAFNEAHDLIAQCEAYRTRHGHYPAQVLADGIYGTRANRRWLKDHGIAFGGKPLGRPPKRPPAEQRAVDKQRYRDACARIPIEGKFGQGKGGYGLAKIAARRADTSEAWVRMIFLVMNLIALEKALFWLRFTCESLRNRRSIAMRWLAQPHTSSVAVAGLVLDRLRWATHSLHPALATSF